MTSQAEENFLISTFCNVPQANAIPLWLGGTDGAQTHIYQWSDGSPFLYTDWNPGEPNDAGGDEDFIALNWHYAGGFTSVQGTWNDTPLNGTQGYGGNTNGPYYGIVERPATAAVPEPSSIALLGLALPALGLMVRRRVRK